MRGIITSVEIRSNRRALRELEAVLAVDRDGDEVAGVDEQPAQRLAHDVGVLDEQDLRRRRRRRAAAARRAAARPRGCASARAMIAGTSRISATRSPSSVAPATHGTLASSWPSDLITISRLPSRCSQTSA